MHDKLVRELRDAVRPLVRRLNSERTMSLAKAGILLQLSEQERATGAELAAAQQVTPQAIGSALQDLEQEGLIERWPDDHDRRRIWVRVTEAGRRRYGADQMSGDMWLAAMIEGRLSDGDRQVLAAAIPVLRRISADSFDHSPLSARSLD